MRGAVCGLLLAIACAPAANYSHLTTQQKIDLIESGKAPRKATLLFVENELNAYVRRRLPEFAPQGVRDTRLSIETGRATGHALVDFSKLRRARGGSTTLRMLGLLMDGERPVTVVARVRSAAGTATVDLDLVEISGVAVPNRAVRLLLDAFVAPHYPEAKAGEPFDLHHNVERLELAPGAARVVLK